MKIPSLIKFLFPVIAFVCILSCQFDAPVGEMIAARTAIEDAKKIEAEKYAADEIKKAETLLLQSQDYITSGKADDAKKSANDSLAAALDAEKKSLPPYAADKIKKSDDAIKEADLAFAEKFSPEKFTGAGTLNSEAKSLYEKKDYKKSAESSMKSYDLAVAAKNESLQNSSVIEKEVTSAENKLSELKGDKFSSAAEGSLANAGTSIGNAKKGMESRDYKTTLKEIDIAKKELDTAAELIRKQKVFASIQALRTEMNSLQGKSGSADVKQDLDSALLELNGAESALEQNNITDAEVKVAQAEKLIRGSDIKMKKQNALAAIDRAEKLLVQARGKDTGMKYKENLDKAGKVIEQGKSAVEAEKFNEGIGNAEEAETIINAVLNSMEAAAAELAVKSAKDEHAGADTKTTETKTDETKVAETKTTETNTDTTAADVKTDEKTVTEPETKEPAAKVYVVQWRKKNTDCLWRIAAKVYKDASYWPAIYLANKDQIKDPDLIFPGQKFTIPPKPQKRPSYKKVKEQIKEKSK